MAFQVDDGKSEKHEAGECMVSTTIGGTVYRCSRTGPHDEHETIAPEYAIVDWKAAFGHARPVLEVIAQNPSEFDERLVASARRALLFVQGKRLSVVPK